MTNFDFLKATGQIYLHQSCQAQMLFDSLMQEYFG